MNTPKILFIAVVLSSFTLFLPIYAKVLNTTNCNIIETFLISAHNVIRLFVVDGEFSFITDNITDFSPAQQKIYSCLFSVLFIMAPFLTFNFVLSFFKNISAYKNYYTNFNKNVYVFSEINERSLALAESLMNNKNEKRLIVFTNVNVNDDSENSELVYQAKVLGAVLFSKDIDSINFNFHSKSKSISFFIFGEDQSANITQSLNVISKYRYRPNSNLYVFSTRIETEMLLTKAVAMGDDNNDGRNMVLKTRIVDEVQSLVLRNLYDNGFDNIFRTAYDDGTDTKKISALVVGMGQHGTEMTKALAWYCQMFGYSIEINSVDQSDIAEDKFCSLCPELMDEKHNGNFEIYGESQYKIGIHSGMSVETKTFDDFVLGLPHVTYVFVCLGNDELNIATAVKLRRLFERTDTKPIIQAIVFNSNKKTALQGITDYSGKEYAIDFIGDMKTSYSESVILHSEVEAIALQRHLKWGKEAEFWQYLYNYRSSMASAIHYKLKLDCKVPGADKTPAERKEDEKVALRILEHRRWNAYMRTEGYIWSGSKEKKSRNNLGKLHHCLIPFEDLPESEQIKDDD